MIKLYNTMARKIEEFKPVKANEVGMYSCGPTVYSYAHIGGMRAAFLPDLIRRVFEYNCYKVKLVTNITDVGHLVSDADDGEDKMESAKKKEGKNAWEIAKFYEAAYLKEREMMNLIMPDVLCRATEHIQEQIDLVKKIEANGYTYRIEDGIYFDTSKLKDYGKLAGTKVDEQQAGARVEMSEGKKNPTDFALWKFSPKGEKRDMEWDSPWGKGFPGWHIECSAMSAKYLGKTFDIHTGGEDLVPIHHTNEIAQSEAANEVQPVNYWVHNAFLNLKDIKMSKSLGNIITVTTLGEKGYSGLDYKYLLLTASYRKQLTFTWEAMDSAKNTMQKLRNIIIEIKSEGGKVSAVYGEKFTEAINDDLDTPIALTIMWEMLRDTKLSNADKYATLMNFDRVFGLNMDKVKEEKLELSPEVAELIRQRDEARKTKNFALSDELRNKIQEKGYSVKDSPEGTKVSRL